MLNILSRNNIVCVFYFSLNLRPYRFDMRSRLEAETKISSSMVMGKMSIPRSWIIQKFVSSKTICNYRISRFNFLKTLVILSNVSSTLKSLVWLLIIPNNHIWLLFLWPFKDSSTENILFSFSPANGFDLYSNFK